MLKIGRQKQLFETELYEIVFFDGEIKAVSEKFNDGIRFTDGSVYPDEYLCREIDVTITVGVETC